ncbi:MAG: hypothetical protein WA880_01585 [Ornithinimicrobium sp.]
MSSTPQRRGPQRELKRDHSLENRLLLKGLLALLVVVAFAYARLNWWS